VKVHLRYLQIFGFLTLLPGCTLSTTLDQGLEYAEQASGELTERSQSWICNRMSVRQWQLTYGTSEERAEAWRTICQAIRVPGVSSL